MTTGDEWVDAKITESEYIERQASRALEKPVKANTQIKHAEWQDGRAYIDDLHYFEVSGCAWNLTVNGYQTAKKWLTDREGCDLTDDDIQSYHRVISALDTLSSESANMRHAGEEAVERNTGVFLCYNCQEPYEESFIHERWLADSQQAIWICTLCERATHLQIQPVPEKNEEQETINQA